MAYRRAKAAWHASGINGWRAGEEAKKHIKMTSSSVSAAWQRRWRSAHQPRRSVATRYVPWLTLMHITAVAISSVNKPWQQHRASRGHQKKNGGMKINNDVWRSMAAKIMAASAGVMEWRKSIAAANRRPYQRYQRRREESGESSAIAAPWRNQSSAAWRKLRNCCLRCWHRDQRNVDRKQAWHRGMASRQLAYGAARKNRVAAAA